MRLLTVEICQEYLDLLQGGVYRRPSLNTFLGIPEAKKRLEKELGVTKAMKPFRWWTNQRRAITRLATLAGWPDVHSVLRQ